MQIREVYCIRANSDPASDLSASQDQPGTNLTHASNRVDGNVLLRPLRWMRMPTPFLVGSCHVTRGGNCIRLN